MPSSVLILEPPDCDLKQLAAEFRELVPKGSEVLVVSDQDSLWNRVAPPESHRQQLVVIPDKFGDHPDAGQRLTAKVRQQHAHVAIVVAAATGDVESAASAIKAGATDFLVLGERLGERLRTLLGKLQGLFDVMERNLLLDHQNTLLRDAIQERFQILGESKPIQQLLDQIRQVSAVPRPLLILGERGTGKEMVARAIHFLAGPDTRPLVTVNCAAFSDALLESELFGHEKGAFTGADQQRPGKFEQASGGTLFLDEIGHMSPAFQQKILRVVEYGVFNRVGGIRELHTDARIIAATNIDLRQKIRDGEFLADLYDRLAFEVLEVPPLRDRTSDIEQLATHFLQQFGRETSAFHGKSLSKEAIAELKKYPFPGNVRELKHIIERTAFHDTGPQISPSDLGLTTDVSFAAKHGSFEEKVDDFSRHLIQTALESSNGNQAAAARELGLSYHQLRYFKKKYLP